jgi:hypothetical protein
MLQISSIDFPLANKPFHMYAYFSFIFFLIIYMQWENEERAERKSKQENRDCVAEEM